MRASTIFPSMMCVTAGAVALLLAGCSSYPEAKEVRANNPTVTYHYRGDEELVDANQKASAFCSQYQSVPRTAHMSEHSSEGRTIVFECVPANSVPMTQNFTPDRPYSYRSDEELLDNSRSAQRYCRNHGGEEATSTITTNPDGTRTVTYQCVMR